MINYKHLIELILEDRKDEMINKYNETGGINSSHDIHATHRSTEGIVDHLLHHSHPEGHQKYLPWLVKHYHAGNLRQEDAPEIKKNLEDFEKHSKKANFTGERDIGKHTPQTLRAAIEPHIGTVASKREAIRGKLQDANIEGADKIFSKGNVTVHHLKTHKAACDMGEGMGLCTAGRDSGGKSMFDTYTRGENDPEATEEEKNHRKLFMVHAKDPKTGKIERYQFNHANGQYMAKGNTPIDVQALVKHNPELKDVKEFQGQHPAFASDKEFAEHKNGKFMTGQLAHATLHDPRIKQADLHKAMTGWSTVAKKAAASSPYLSKEGHEEALEDQDEDVYSGAVENKRTKGNQLTNALKHPSKKIRLAAASHENAEPKHIDKSLKDPEIAMEAIKNPNANHRLHEFLGTPDVIGRNSEYLPGITHQDMKKAALENPSITPEHLDTALANGDREIAEKVVSHPAAEQRHIEHGLAHEDIGVQGAAIRNRRASMDQVNEVLNRKPDIYGSWSINHMKKQALENPKIKPHHISQILNDPREHDDVKAKALSHFHFDSLPEEEKKTHLRNALTSNNPYVESAILQHPNLNLLSDEERKNHISKILNNKDNANYHYNGKIEALNHEDFNKLPHEEKSHHLRGMLKPSQKTEGGEDYITRRFNEVALNHPHFAKLPVEERVTHVRSILNDPKVELKKDIIKHPEFNALSDEERSKHIGEYLADKKVDPYYKGEIMKHQNFHNLPDQEKTKHAIKYLEDQNGEDTSSFITDKKSHFHKLPNNIKREHINKFLFKNPTHWNRGNLNKALDDLNKEE
jgi:hypothetical protein